MIEFTTMACIVMGIAQLMKKLNVKNKWLPFVNVFVAMALSLIWKTELTLTMRLQQGLLIGLSASGIYDLCIGFKKENQVV